MEADFKKLEKEIEHSNLNNTASFHTVKSYYLMVFLRAVLV